MARKLIIIGCHSFAAEVAKSIKELAPEIDVTISEKLRSQFDPEPIRLNNFRDDDTQEFNLYEQAPSKFIGKPKNNFKKR